MSVPAVTLFGVTISKLNMEQTVEYLTSAIESGTPHQVITANPIMMMEGLRNEKYREVLKQAELVVPDGAGLVWAARYAGNPVAERVAGYDLLHRLLERGQRFGWKVYLLGAAPDVVRDAAERLRQLYPGIRIAGYRDGFFTDDQDEEIVREIAGLKPDLLFVANSLHRQEPWIGQYKRRLRVPVMMGVGGSFDIIAGRLKRAPLLFQKLRLEWLFRLLQEPSRYKRMLDLPKFVIHVIRNKESIRREQKEL